MSPSEARDRSSRARLAHGSEGASPERRFPVPVRADAPPAAGLRGIAHPSEGFPLRSDLAAVMDALPGWEAAIDRASGLPARLYGPGIPVGGPEVDLARFAESFLREHAPFLGFDPDQAVHDLEFRQAVPLGSGREIVFVDRSWRGLPVEGARGDLRFVSTPPPRGGMAEPRLTMVRLDLGGPIDLDPVPWISESSALSRASEAVAATGRSARGPARIDDGRPLAVVRGEDAWRLAWTVRLEVTDPPGSLTLWIDAHDASVIAVRDEYRYTATALSVTGGHEPRRAGDAEILSPFRALEVLSGGTAVAVTDSTGDAIVDVPAGGATYQLRLAGPYTEVTAPDDDSAIGSVTMQPGMPASFLWEDANSYISERDVFQSHGVVRDRMKRMAPDVAWLDTRVPFEVDTPDTQGCNAFWDGTRVKFFQESATCNATGRIADVVYHECGHGLHQHLSSGGYTAGDIGEGSADYLSATITGDPDIGPSFFKDSPDGIRNLEPDRRYPEDVVGQIHTDGLIWGGAFWDLRKAMIAVLGSDDGVIFTDELLANTLRSDPSLDGGFYDVLFAADDDGDLTNGVPYECPIVQAFGAHGLGPGDGLAITHLPLGLQPPERDGYAVRAYVAPAFPACAGTGVAQVELEWRLAGEVAWTSVPMSSDPVPRWRSATIPAQEEGSQVEYRLSASDDQGRVVTLPEWNFESAPFRMRVGTGWTVYRDDFEEDRGWTHALLSGGNQEGADDWQLGPPNGAAGDPRLAFSGSSVWGNDLGVAPYNGAYQPGIRNRLTSPPIDCRRASGTRLQLRRWLNVEKGIEDQARILVNDEVVWSNPLEETIRDRAWRFEEIDISALADGKRVRIAFELESGSRVQLGGWTIDDVAITATGTRALPPRGCACRLEGGFAGSSSAGWATIWLAAGAWTWFFRRRRATA